MTDLEFQSYLDKVNRKAEPFVPLVNCGECGLPIEDECVIIPTSEEPIWLHLWCDDLPAEAPGWELQRAK